LVEIEPVLLDLFTVTAFGFTDYGGYRHFGILYAYSGKILLPEKTL
jgi:hypothetical protein